MEKNNTNVGMFFYVVYTDGYREVISNVKRFSYGARVFNFHFFDDSFRFVEADVVKLIEIISEEDLER